MSYLANEMLDMLDIQRKHLTHKVFLPDHLNSTS